MNKQSRRILHKVIKCCDTEIQRVFCLNILKSNKLPPTVCLFSGTVLQHVSEKRMFASFSENRFAPKSRNHKFNLGDTVLCVTTIKRTTNASIIVDRNLNPICLPNSQRAANIVIEMAIWQAFLSSIDLGIDFNLDDFLNELRKQPRAFKKGPF